MTGMTIAISLLLLASGIDDVLSQAETTEALGNFAENTVLVVSSGALLGLGIGIILGGIVMYKYQELQLNSSNRTSKL